MDVLDEILKWSTTLPTWQRDALRRLVVTGGPLTESDLEELTELCKAAHGLAEKRAADPLQEAHIPTRDPSKDIVALSSITHHAGVNALAPEQTIEFGAGLTIVYGDNAAGKSGYTRVLKRACRARGAEEILGNVLAVAATGRPAATIRFTVGDKEEPFEWTDQEVSQHPLGNVSVFDTHCASVYLREKTDVAFRPLGLDLFDKLSQACEDVRRVLEKERVDLESPAEFDGLSEGTAVFDLVTNITSLTKPETVKALATLSGEEQERIVHLREQVKDLESKNPRQTSRALALRAQRQDTLASHLRRVEDALSDETVASAFKARSDVEAARSTVKDLHTTTFSAELLAGTGSDTWRALWEAARKFSTDEPYPDRDFPVTEDASCVLCQQNLSDTAAERLTRFEAFIGSPVQQELDRVRTDYAALHQTLQALEVHKDTTDQSLEELRLDAEELAGAVEAALPLAEERRTRVLASLNEGRPLPDDLPRLALDSAAVASHAEGLRTRARNLLYRIDDKAHARLSGELLELEDRETLGTKLEDVLEAIERKKKLAAYELCRRDTNTRGITRKSSEVTKAAVTKRLAKSFQDELTELRFTHLEVELHEAGGARGALYHKLVLRRATGVDLLRVVSEGEARTLSIAAFFAELSTSTDRSAILFDDPVSSLDHSWRESVALRLTNEARARQVVVFTHDIAFLVALVAAADESGTQYQHQYLRRDNLGAGMSSPDLPWIAMKVKERLGVLRNEWQDAERLFRVATRDRYERAAKYTYGLLREAWERALEEVMLGGVVERYRRSIQTKQAKNLHDITEADCAALDAGMTKSSRWLPGHDQAPAENVPVPEPDELKADIDALDNWIKVIRKRRS